MMHNVAARTPRAADWLLGVHIDTEATNNCIYGYIYILVFILSHRHMKRNSSKIDLFDLFICKMKYSEF